MSEKFNEKEIYRLWWDYLKRSEGYKEYCKDIDDFCEKENLYFNSSDWPSFPIDFKYVLATEKMPKKLSGSKFWGNLTNFGNVFSDSFEEWHKRHIEELKVEERKFPPVQNYRECFEHEFVRCIGDFIRQNGRKPTLEEFGTAFKNYLEDSDRSVTLKIDCKNRFSNEEILKKCGDFIREKRKQPTKFKYELLLKSYTVSTSRVDIDKLKRYLRVYDLYNEGKKIDDIIKLIGNEYQKENFDFPEVQRVFWRDIQNAKKIIQNVEEGLFPGPLTNKK